MQWPCNPHTTAGIIWWLTQSQGFIEKPYQPSSYPYPWATLRSLPSVFCKIALKSEHSSKSKQLLKMSCSLRSNFHFDKELQPLKFNWVCNIHASFSWKLDIVVWGGDTPRELIFLFWLLDFVVFCFPLNMLRTAMLRPQQLKLPICSYLIVDELWGCMYQDKLALNSLERDLH